MTSSFQRIECCYMLGTVAFLALPIFRPFRGYMAHGLDSIWYLLAISLLFWIPASFLVHLVKDGGMNLRRWIWISALVTEIIALIVAVKLHLPELLMGITGIGLAATPFLYILICITETWLPWLNRQNIRKFIIDLDI